MPYCLESLTKYVKGTTSYHNLAPKGKIVNTVNQSLVGSKIIPSQKRQGGNRLPENDVENYSRISELKSFGQLRSIARKNLFDLVTHRPVLESKNPMSQLIKG